MIKINVIDLDKALLPYDSFRLLVKLEFKKLNVIILWWTLLRKLRLLSAAKFKQLAILNFRKKYSEAYFREFALKLFEDLDREVMEMIRVESRIGEINILLSASPNLYVQHLINKLGWQGSGSYFVESDFIHLHGPEKLKWLRHNYSSEDFEYNFSISDSSSDSLLLEQFKKKIFWTKNSSKESH